jgi:hypothetical protein
MDDNLGIHLLWPNHKETKTFSETIQDKLYQILIGLEKLFK